MTGIVGCMLQPMCISALPFYSRLEGENNKITAHELKVNATSYKTKINALKSQLPPKTREDQVVFNNMCWQLVEYKRFTIQFQEGPIGTEIKLELFFRMRLLTSLYKAKKHQKHFEKILIMLCMVLKAHTKLFCYLHTSFANVISTLHR